MFNDHPLNEKIAFIEQEYWWYRARRDIVISLLDKYLRGNQVILNLGCGTGANSAAFAKYGVLYDTDISAIALEFCKQRKCSFLTQSDAITLPFADNAFSCVLCLDVIEHLKDDSTALLEINRVLTSSGILLLTVPATPWLWTYRDKIEGHYRRYTRRELIRLLENSGLKVLTISYFNSILFPLVLLDWLGCKMKPQDKYTFPEIPKAVNFLLKKSFALEKYFLPKPGFAWGKSLIAVTTLPTS